MDSDSWVILPFGGGTYPLLLNLNAMAALTNRSDFVPVSGPRPSETGSLCFLCLGTFTFGPHPFCKGAKAALREGPYGEVMTVPADSLS